MAGLKTKMGFKNREDVYGELFGVKYLCEETMGNILTYIDRTLLNTDNMTEIDDRN